jgi:hypothetical protein
MVSKTYKCIPIADASLNPEAAKLFPKIRADINELLNKIKHDSEGNAPVDLNAAIEEAYVRALIVSGVLIPFPESVALIAPTQNSVH